MRSKLAIIAVFVVIGFIIGFHAFATNTVADDITISEVPTVEFDSCELDLVGGGTVGGVASSGGGATMVIGQY